MTFNVPNDWNKEAREEQKYCHKCAHAESYPDPDSNDWFCDDDILWKCTLNEALIDRACRPYQKVKQPDWCPMLQKE